MFLIENDVDIINECGFSKNDINHQSLEFKNNLLQQKEQYLDYVKNEEESVIEEILNSKWKLILLQCFKMLDMKEV